MPASYVLRIDDIAPTMDWANFDRLCRLVDECDVSPLIGVIPDNHDPDLLRWPTAERDFWSQIRSCIDRGWEVAVHGFQHRYVTEHPGLLGLNEKSEFAGLPYPDQLEKLERAVGIFRRHGVESRTFMAPAHSYDENTLRAVRSVGLRFVTDGLALYPYEERGLVFVPQLFARPRKMPFGIFTTCIHLNGLEAGEMATLESFVRSHHDAVIDFEEAASRVVAGRWNRAIGTGVGMVLGGLRKGRARLRAMAGRKRD